VKKILITLFAIISLFSFAQKQGNIWCFVDSSGIDFNSGNATLFLNSIMYNSAGQENQASISDKNGNLLFYTNGITVWNKNHQVMQNGNGLNGSNDATQGVIIIPRPEDSTGYYVFTVKSTGLFYNIVDITLDGGNGGIINGYKNIVILDTLMNEKQMAVKHANGRDWWLIVHGGRDQLFYKFLVTKDSIILNDLQQIGSMQYAWGEMEFSRNGDKMLAAGNSEIYAKGCLDLFDFDRCSGLLSNWISLGDTNVITYYGCSFSASGKLLYASTFDTLYQYDCSVADIKSSKKIIWINPYYNPNPVPHYRIGQHQLGPDDKIYVAVAYAIYPNNVHSFQNQNLCVINNPDSMGSACNFVPFTFNLGIHRVEFGLPNMPNYNLGALAESPCDTLSLGNENIKISEGIIIYPNPTDNNITIELQSIQTLKSIIYIYDIRGQLLFQIPTQQARTDINVSNLSKGIYILKILNDDRLIFKKFIKE
jgi:hypothetical protein